MSGFKEFKYEIMLVGDAGAGKTAFLERLATGAFKRNYIATLENTVHVLSFELNDNRVVTLRVTDTSGQRFGNQIEGKDGVIIMYDQSSRVSRKNVEFYKNVMGNVPVLIVGNKSDTGKKFVGRSDDVVMSVMSCVGLYEPLLNMIRTLVHDPTTNFSWVV